MGTVNDIRIPTTGPPDASFTIAPEGSAVSITVGGHTYTWTAKHHAHNTTLTFTATSTAGVEFTWDFGDGTIKRGATVTYKYPYATPEAQVELTVRDSHGRTTRLRRTLNLT